MNRLRYMMPHPSQVWRPGPPAEFYGKSREEIVALLVQFGYQRELAEREADAFIEYRGGTEAPTPTPSNTERPDSGKTGGKISFFEKVMRRFHEAVKRRG